MSLLFNMLSRLVIVFLPRSKCLLISLLQSPSTVTLEYKKIVCHCFHCFPIYLPWRTGSPVLHYLLEFAQIHICCVSDAVWPSSPLCPLLLLPSVFPSIRVFSSESVLHIRWPKDWSFSFSHLSFRVDCLWELTGLVSLLSKGLSRVFSSTTVRKHQFYSTQPSLCSKSHIHTRLLAKL